MSRNIGRKLSAISRELAFKIIFQLEFNNIDIKDVDFDYEIENIMDTLSGKNDIDSVDDAVSAMSEFMERVETGKTKEKLQLKPENIEYVKNAVNGTMNNLSDIDDIISDYLKQGWSIKRLAAVDRNVLRLAIYELKFDNNDILPKTIVNDAVNIAKKYGTDTSSRFVNGVLSAIIK